MWFESELKQKASDRKDVKIVVFCLLFGRELQRTVIQLKTHFFLVVGGSRSCEIQATHEKYDAVSSMIWAREAYIEIFLQYIAHFP